MARLHYSSTDEAGYTRRRCGRGFTYLDTQGKTIRDQELREWIKSLTIPPAWTDVWINPRKNGHILATGRDEKDRKQYIYHPDWQAEQSQKKFNRLYEFGEALPHLREVTDQHLRKHKLSRERVLAAVVRLLERTLIRIGNSEYAQRNDSHGLTTLEDDHAEIRGSKILFDFVGKSGIEHTVVLRDRRLARVVQKCQDIPGYELFQYTDENGEHQAIGSADVNAYLQRITGKNFTAKVFRTWGGSTLALKCLAEVDSVIEESQAIRHCVARVAESLGNTEAVARDYYIHPLVFDAYTNGSLRTLYQKYAACETAKHELAPEEQTLMRLIEQCTDKTA